MFRHPGAGVHHLSGRAPLRGSDILHQPTSVTHLQDLRRVRQGKLIGIQVGRTVSVKEVHVTSLYVEVRHRVHRLGDRRLLMEMTREMDLGTHRRPDVRVHHLAEISPIKMTGVSSLYGDALESRTGHQRRPAIGRQAEIDHTQMTDVVIVHHHNVVPLAHPLVGDLQMDHQKGQVT